MSFILDTHTVIWFLCEPEKLGKEATQSIDKAVQNKTPLYVSAISLVEIVYLGEKGRIPANAADKCIELISSEPSFSVAPIDAPLVASLKNISRDMIPDMPDRIIAATAQHLNLPLITRDEKIRSSQVKTIW